jgi:filamentous hemagglutinin
MFFFSQIICSLFFIVSLFGGFGPDTLVKVPDGYKPISQLTVGDSVISCDCNGNISQERILLTTKYCSEEVCHCKTKESGDFYVGVNQLFVDPETNALVLPDQLDVNYQCFCQNVDDQTTELHEIIIGGNHLFYVITDDILVHNMIQIPLEVIECVGNQFFLNLPDQYEKLLCAGFLLAVEFYNNIPQKLYIIEDTDKEKNLLLSKNDSNRDTQLYRFGAPEDKYCSMNEFLKNTKMGQDIKNKIVKKREFTPRDIYQVLETIPQYNLKKGDYIYVDRKHCDHLEVFGKNRLARTVLNFNGSINKVKAKNAEGRVL